MGKKLNEKYALYWVQENKSLFDSEFAHVGVTNQQNGALIDAESANSFKFYATGRANCAYSLVSLDYKKRQDLLSMFVFNFIWPEKDTIRIEIPIETPTPLPFVFAVVKKKEVKNVQNNFDDIKTFCRKFPQPDLTQYVVLSESEEISNFVLTKQVVSVLKKYEKVIEVLLFSDLRHANKQFLRVDLNVPKDFLKNPSEFQVLIKMLFYLADNTNFFKMSNAARTKAEKERLVYHNAKIKESQKEKQEEIQKKLQEKKKRRSCRQKKR